MFDSTPLSTQASPAARAANPTFDISQLKRTFDEEGYIVLPAVVEKSELVTVESRLRDEFATWQSSPAAFRGGGVLSGHLNCYPGTITRGVLDQLKDAGILPLVQQLFPTNPRAIRMGCNFNLPGSVEQHYHMDGIYLESFVIVNICVVDTDLTNGAIELAPKTHQRFYRFWEFAAGRVHRTGKRICMSRGDVLIRISTLWHRGMPNRSRQARPMLAVTLGEKHVDTDDPLSFNDGRVEFQANWFRTNLLGRLRERTTVHAPITYSAYRFARSLVGSKGYDF
jgi:ectoine hydroxylase-related dioxygenase (phytanoyl-CoA dioxygenase family)